MIVIQLQGGLGNQMFQYAAAKALATIRQTTVGFDMSWFDKNHGGSITPRTYELDMFELHNSVKILKPGLRSKFRLKMMRSYTEPYFHYDKNFNHNTSNTLLHGYFQSEKYFKNSRENLIEDFAWTKPASGKNKTLLEAIKGDGRSVSLHVRRGDYAHNQHAKSFHGLVPESYYQEAIIKILEHIKQPNLYIFSDDPEWCRQHLTFKLPATYVDHNSHGSDDMRLMTACRHNIIANSSFSWWAAWLNQNASKVVCAPQQWFSHPESNTKDLLPQQWHRL